MIVTQPGGLHSPPPSDDDQALALAMISRTTNTGPHVPPLHASIYILATIADAWERVVSSAASGASTARHDRQPLLLFFLSLEEDFEEDDLLDDLSFRVLLFEEPSFSLSANVSRTAKDVKGRQNKQRAGSFITPCLSADSVRIAHQQREAPRKFGSGVSYLLLGRAYPWLPFTWACTIKMDKLH